MIDEVIDETGYLAPSALGNEYDVVGKQAHLRQSLIDTPLPAVGARHGEGFELPLIAKANNDDVARRRSPAKAHGQRNGLNRHVCIPQRDCAGRVYFTSDIHSRLMSLGSDN